MEQEFDEPIVVERHLDAIEASVAAKAMLRPRARADSPSMGEWKDAA
jgi:hypothetical protein